MQVTLVLFCSVIAETSTGCLLASSANGRKSKYYCYCYTIVYNGAIAN